jgi:rSAM/selenodomain-associated transferase 2
VTGTGETLTIVVPALDEAGGIVAALVSLAPLRARGHQVIVVDGGSGDGTAALARPHADVVVEAPRSRARQMNAGAAVADGGALLFLHADTVLPRDADRSVFEALRGGADWGRFDVRIEGRSPMLGVVAALMNLRSRFTGIATGDQAIFVRRSAFEAVGGFPDQPLMEDIELSKRLRRIGRPACLRARAATSGRRWESRGVWRTILLMWRLRWRYWRGESAEVLARAYR